MNISNIKVITGPNYWSADHSRLIVASVSDFSTIKADPRACMQEIERLFTYKNLRFMGSPTDASDCRDLVLEIVVKLLECTGFTCSFCQLEKDPLDKENQFIFEYEEAG